MSQVDEDPPNTNNPTGILSSALKSIPELPANPKLATIVFETIRKGCRRVKSLPFISPLLPALTSVALITEYPSLRHDAAQTCIALLAALVSRQAPHLASIYVVDLTVTARQILEHQSAEPLHSLFPQFKAKARQLAISDLETSTIESAKVLPVPVSPRSLESLLWLLAVIILPNSKPSGLESIHPLDNEVLSGLEFVPTQSEAAESAPIRLWRLLGARARAAVLNLTSSHILLSGRCGARVTFAAISVLERAFDITSGCIVPTTIRRRLSSILETLVVSHPHCPDDIQSSVIRAALYRLSRIADPSMRLPAAIWSCAGMRDAVSSKSDLAKILVEWSRNGLVSYTLSDPESAPRPRRSSSKSSMFGPPRKKQRLDLGKCSKDSSTPTVTPTDQYQQRNMSDTAVLTDPTIVLKWELQGLNDTGRYTSDAEAVLILVRVTSITADTLCAFGKQKSSLLKLQQWHIFLTTITTIVKEVSLNVNLDTSKPIWDALLSLEKEILRLLASFPNVREALRKSGRENCASEDTRFSLCDSTLFSSVVSVLNTASLALDSTPKNLPVTKLAAVLWDVGEILLLLSYPASDQDSLSKTVQRVRSFCLNGSADITTEEVGLLLKGTFHVIGRLKATKPLVMLDEESQGLSDLLSDSISSCPECAASVFFAKADILCAALGCNGLHVFSCEPRFEGLPRMDMSAWKRAFSEVAVIVKGTGADEVIAAATYFLGRIALHSPVEKVGETAAVLIRTLSHPTSHEAREHAISVVRSLATDKDVSQTAGNSLSSPRGGAIFSTEDSCDGIDVVFTPKGDGSDIFRLLGVELKSQLDAVNRYIQEGGISRLDETKLFSLSTAAQLPHHNFVTSKVIGLSCHSLLSIAVAELLAWPLSNANLNAVPHDPERTITRKGLKLKAWHCLLSFVANQEDQEHFGQKISNIHETFSFRNCSSTSHLGIVWGQLPLTTCIANFLNSRIKEWIPFSLHRLVQSNHVAEKVSSILLLDPKSLWKKLPRHVMGHLIRAKDSVGLEALALRVNEPAQSLVQTACSEAFARVAMLYPHGLDLSAEGPSSLIQHTLQQPLREVVGLHVGKIVQRIVMDIGGYKSERARNALQSVAKILRPDDVSPRVAAALVSDHFMLVMDAVNRGLFQSKGTLAERCRYLEMLNGVINVASEYLHFYIPKVLATLKLALDNDRGSAQFRLQTLRVWINFLEAVRSKHILPHLGLILSILIPFVHSHGDLLCSTLGNIAEKARRQKNFNLSEIILLLHLSGHETLKQKAQTMDLDVQSELRRENTSVSFRTENPASVLLRPRTSAHIIETCKNVAKVVAQHENETIELRAVEHLLQLLRQNRNFFDAVLRTEPNADIAGNRSSIGVVATLLRVLVGTLGRTKNKKSQDRVMQCIGEVGALDPVLFSRFDKSSSQRNHSTVVINRRSCPKQVHSLVTTLLDDFLAPALARGEKRGGFQNQGNRFGMVIQELLRICGCKKDTAVRANNGVQTNVAEEDLVNWDSSLAGPREEVAISFWVHLKSSTRPAVQPYLEEIFNVDDYKDVFGGNAGNIQLGCEPQWRKIKAASPIDHIPSADEWRRQMVVQLVDYVGDQGKFGATLKALRPALRYDDNLSAFIFPLVVMTALDTQRRTRSIELQQYLAQEITYVLNEGTSPQPIFDLMDTLRHWREERCKSRGQLVPIRDQTAVQPDGSKKPCFIEGNIEKERRSDPLTPFVDLDGSESKVLSLLVLARSAVATRSYARAILFAECHIRNLRKKREFNSWPAMISSLRSAEGRQGSPIGAAQREAFSILQKCFLELEDAESMAGVASLRAETSLMESVIDEEAIGSYDRALITYERAIATNPRNEKLHSGFLSCLMTLGHWETLLSHAEGLLTSATLRETGLLLSAQSHGIEAAWRLERWEKVRSFGYISLDARENVLKPSTRPWMLDFNISFGKMMYSLHMKDPEAVKNAASEARAHLLEPAIRLAREGYVRAYPSIVLLQTVSEVEDALAAVVNNRTPHLITLRGRIDATAQSLRTKEPLLSTRKVCFKVCGNPCEAAKVNLELSSLAHASGNLKAAAAYAFESSNIASNDEYIINTAVQRMAQIRHEQGDAIEALLMIRKEIERLAAALSECQNQLEKIHFSERLCTANVVAGRWIEETRSEPSYAIQECYEQAGQYGPNREEPFYVLGRHFDTLLQTRAGGVDVILNSADGSRSSRRSVGNPSGGNLQMFSEYVPLIIKCFTRALCNGHTRLYDALPRMLTIWFDYHSAADSPDSKLAGSAVDNELKAIIKKSFDSIPNYMWITAVPQLMSRVLHPRKQVRDQLTNFLARIMCLYPDQTVWMILPANQLKNKERRKAASIITNTAIRLLQKRKVALGRAVRNAGVSDPSEDFKSKMQSSLNIIHGFVNICLEPIDKSKKSRSYDFSLEFRGIKHNLKLTPMMNPMIPTLASLTVQMPSASGKNHRPFGDEPVRISDLENQALVMSSVMKPRRITLVGSDGKKYRYLAKQEASGDMRKDSRLIEFVTVVNRLLSKDAISKKRDISLRPYAVLPLTEEAGMIEWVDDLTPLRTLVQELHKRIAGLPDMRTIQQKYQKLKNHRKFLEWALGSFPPVLNTYFLESYGAWSDPQKWFEARNMWTQSVASWSMTGYVVGLGDRHGENILIETTTGRCVHVDFAMLFDKGAHLRVPEVVPFRLTQNMVTSMGIAGYEGVFRSVSESVLRILRGNTEGLMGVLESFLYDPLADWSKIDMKGAHGNVQVIASKEAWEMRNAVKAKLGGMMEDSQLPLSIEGQVQRLIHEAVSLDNLSRMYIWWSGWI